MLIRALVHTTGATSTDQRGPAVGTASAVSTAYRCAVRGVRDAGPPQRRVSVTQLSSRRVPGVAHSESQARPAKVTRECSTNTRKNQGVSGSAAATDVRLITALQVLQVPPPRPREPIGCAEEAPSQPFWRPAPFEFFDSDYSLLTDRSDRKVPSDRKVFAAKNPRAKCFHSGRDSQVSMSEAWGSKRLQGCVRIVHSVTTKKKVHPDTRNRRRATADRQLYLKLSQSC